MKSMTGFGRGEATARGVRAEVELSSVNRKQLDIRITLPRNLTSLESRVVQETSRRFSRGHITGTVTTSSPQSDTRTVKVDETAVSSYIRELRRAARRFKLKDDLTASSLLGMSSVMVLERSAPSADASWTVIRKALNKALAELADMRAREGKALLDDLTQRFATLKALLERVSRHAPAVQDRYRKALIKRLRQAGIDAGKATAEITRELVLFADRSDITEEITRLHSHLAQGDSLLAKTGPTGRTLDFLAQEMFREINTIGSKANDARISALVIKFKAELERAREQIQNVE